MGPATKNQTILTVDDRVNSLKVLAAILTDEGYDVLQATSGQEALDICASGILIDLVLSDLKMPAMDGLELYQRLAADGTAPPFVIMSAYGTAECALETMQLGAADILRKPFAPDELRTAVADVMRRDLDPEVVEGRFQKDLRSARDHIRAQRIPAGVELARDAIAMHPGRAEGYHLLGVCHDLLAERAEAEKMYHLALEAEPGYAPAQHNLHRLVFFRGTRGTVDLG